MVITAFRLEGPESFVIEIDATRVGQLLEVFQGDFKQLATHLKLMNDRMVLVNPKFESFDGQEGPIDEVGNETRV